MGTATDQQLIVAPMNPAYLPQSLDYHLEIIVLDVSCPNYSAILDKSDKLLRYARWILFNETHLLPMGDGFYAHLAGLDVLVDSEITFVHRGDTQESILVKQIYKTGQKEPLIAEDIGFFVNSSFIENRISKIKSRRRQDLKLLRLRASMVVTGNDTLDHLTDYR